MHEDSLNDTIAAPSTPAGEGGIGIVRMSGAKALKIADITGAYWILTKSCLR
ncbi:MAG: hypothetical protein NT036_02525 [Candidatus Omnitrophica bacterium]|nr:hypothetical protein [Candidatus Omnitrophota bacterium]